MRARANLCRVRLSPEQRSFSRDCCFVLATVTLWALLFLPNVGLRSLYYEEGLAALQARDILARGDWLVPQVFGERWVEKPALYPWLVALTSWLTGALDEWSVRLPALLASLAGALLVYAIVRAWTGGLAAFVSALAFLLTPHIMGKAAVGEVDLLLSVLSLGAWYLWWAGQERDRVGVGRVIAIGLLLIGVALCKGPQPLGYYAIGVLLLIGSKRRWRLLLPYGVTLAFPAVALGLWTAAVYAPGDEATWQRYMRLGAGIQLLPYLQAQALFLGELLAETLPWVLLAGLALLPGPRRRLGPALKLVDPLLLYCLGCTAALLLWPHALPRYAMPAMPGIAIIAGLVLDRGLSERRLAMAVALACILALAGFHLHFTLWTVRSDLAHYAASRSAGDAIGAAVASDGAPLFATDFDNHNVAAYIKQPIRRRSLAELEERAGSFWLLCEQPESCPPPQSPGQVVWFERPVRFMLFHQRPR